MHDQSTIAIGAITLMVLVAAGIVLLMLFSIKKTRPAAWLIAIVLLIGMSFFVYQSTGPQWRPAAQTQSVEHWPDVEFVPGGHSNTVDRVLQPRIHLSDSAVQEESAHPLQAARPLQRAAKQEPLASTAESSAAESQPSTAAVDTREDGSDSATSSNDGSIGGVNEPSVPRPPWVDKTPPRDGNSYMLVKQTDPFSKKQDADQQVNELVVIAAAEVLDDLLGSQYMTRHGFDHNLRYSIALGRLNEIGLNPGLVRNWVWRDEFVEYLDLDMPTGLMVRVHTLLEFDRGFQGEILKAWEESQADQRIAAVGITAVSIFGLLALVWSVLKLDTVTKGYYTKWLLIGGGLVTMLVVGFFLIALS